MRDVLYKTGTEKQNYKVDVVADVPSGASISSVAATAVDSAAADVSASLIGTVTSSGTVITVPLKAFGTDRETYTVKISATMNDSFGTIAERYVDVRIRNSDYVE